MLKTGLHHTFVNQFFNFIIRNLISIQTNIADIGNSLTGMFEYGPGNPILVWMPVVEPDFGQERFLTEDPAISFKKGNFARVPILAGIAKYEFLHPAISKKWKNFEFYDE